MSAGIVNAMIVLGYLVIAGLLLDHGTSKAERMIRRIKFSLLGLASLTALVGRMDYVPDPNDVNDWIFNLHHFAFIGFGALYFLDGYRRTKGGEREGAERERLAEIEAIASLVARKLREDQR